jgi:hypothetical protein
MDKILQQNTLQDLTAYKNVKMGCIAYNKSL